VKPNLTGITAAGTVPDSHRIPLHCDNGVITITTKFRRKGITFFPTHQISQRLNNLKTISENPKQSQLASAKSEKMFEELFFGGKITEAKVYIIL